MQVELHKSQYDDWKSIPVTGLHSNVIYLQA